MRGPAITEIDSHHLRGRGGLNRQAHLILSVSPPIDVNAWEFAGNRGGNTVGMWENGPGFPEVGTESSSLRMGRDTGTLSRRVPEQTLCSLRAWPSGSRGNRGGYHCGEAPLRRPPRQRILAHHGVQLPRRPYRSTSGASDVIAPGSSYREFFSLGSRGPQRAPDRKRADLARFP